MQSRPRSPVADVHPGCWLLLLQVCNDVQIMKYETQCQQVQQMKTKCDIVMNQQCNKVGHTSRL